LADENESFERHVFHTVSRELKASLVGAVPLRDFDDQLGFGLFMDDKRALPNADELVSTFLQCCSVF
jgi:hypothetical protein